MAASNYSAVRTYSTAFPILNYEAKTTLTASASFNNPTILPYATTQTGIMTFKDLIKQSGYTTSTSGESSSKVYANRWDNTMPCLGSAGTTYTYLNYWKPTFNNTGAYNSADIIGSAFHLGQSYTGGGAMTIGRAVTMEVNAPDTFATLAPAAYFGLIVRGTALNAALAVDNNENVMVRYTNTLATNATNGFFCLPTCAGKPTGTPTSITQLTAPVVIDTTNNQLCYYNHSLSAWISPGLAVIERRVVSVASPTITFSSIPQTYKNLKIVFSGHSSSSGNMKITVNNVTTATYDSQYLYGNVGTVAAGRDATIAFWYGPPINTSASGYCVNGELTLPDYTGSNIKSYCIYGGGSTAASTSVYEVHAGCNRSTTAISRVDFTITGGFDFSIGFIATLYGYM